LVILHVWASKNVNTLNTMNTPFFSVITPTYNRVKFLSKAVQSVLGQSLNDFELIIIDDGSTDRTRSFVESFADPRIVYQFQKNHGVAHARNRGIELAQSEWIAFLDSDDWWLPQKLDRMHVAIQENPDIKIFHTEEKWFRQGQIHNPKKKYQKPTGWAYPSAIKICSMSLSTAVIHQSVFDAVGTFDEELLACEDYDFWLRSTHQFEVKLIEEYLTEKEGGA